MKNRRLVIALGLAALLLPAGSIAGCGPTPGGQASRPPGSHWPANPMEEMENPDEGHGEKWEGSLYDIPGYPEGMPVGGGIVRKVTANTLDLEVATGGTATMQGGPSGWDYEPGTETKIAQVVFNPDMKVYRMLHRVAKPELEELTLADIEVGDMITVWGEESGDRIFADTIITKM